MVVRTDNRSRISRFIVTESDFEGNSDFLSNAGNDDKSQGPDSSPRVCGHKTQPMILSHQHNPRHGIFTSFHVS